MTSTLLIGGYYNHHAEYRPPRGTRQLLVAESATDAMLQVCRDDPTRQLAAAIVSSENRPATLPFVCLDDRLTAAALREGFDVVGARCC